MTKASVRVTIGDLPHGRIPYEDIANQQLKNKVMLLNDNIAALKSQLETAQRAIQELQRR